MANRISPFRLGLKTNEQAGRYLCVGLASRAEQVPGAGVDGEGFLLDPLTALALFNRALIRFSCQEASAYRLSLATYVLYGSRWLRELEEVVEAIRLNAPRALILLDALGQQSEPGDSSCPPERLFALARSLLVDAVVVSPCAGAKALAESFRLALARSEEEKTLEVFVSCSGCRRSEKQPNCFNPTVESSTASPDQWLDWLIGHGLSCEEYAGLVLHRLDAERLSNLRSTLHRNPITLLAPWEAFATTEENFPFGSRQELAGSGLLVEVSADSFRHQPAQLARINQLMRDSGYSLASA